MKYRILGRLAPVAGLLAMAVPASAQMSLPGKFEVTDTGSASYTIPIQVVPGTAGLEPKLSLQYDSRSGSGLLGVGWSLSGLPSITRCGRTIAQDGVTGGVAYDANDRYCLDGQRLIAITGTYGADQTEYRTERESFSKVISYGQAGSGPAHFKVWTKAGLIMEFGNSADSRIEAQGKTSVRVWAINRTSDTKGNYFTVTYLEDNANGEYRPDRIDYTGNSVTGTNPTNSVRFVYETRPDIVPLYQAGSMIKTTKRMTKVQAWQQESLIWEYQSGFEVSAATGATRLNSSKYCTGIDCMPVQTFSYGGAPQSWTTLSNVANSNGTMLYWRAFFGDFNADAKADALWLEADVYGRTSGALKRSLWMSNGDGTFAVTNNLASADGTVQDSRPYIHDFNGDGFADIFWNYTDQTERSHNVSQARSLWLGNGNGNGGFTVINNVNGANNTMLYWMPLFADFNNDGKTDIFWFEADIYQRSGGAFKRSLWISNGDGTFAVTNNLASADGTVQYSRPYIHDFNGDGFADIFWNYTDQTERSHNVSQARSLWLGNGNGGFTAINNVNGADNTLLYWMPQFADFNNDGKTDIFWFEADIYQRSGGSFRRSLWISNGNGTFAVTNNLASADGTVQYSRPYIHDFNGDGSPDIFWNYTDQTQRSHNVSQARSLWIGDGGGGFTAVNNVNGANNTMLYWKPMFADFNADGKTDVLWFDADIYERSGGAFKRSIWTSNGDGTFAVSNNTASADGAVQYSQPYIQDFNGDGRPDILWDYVDQAYRSNSPSPQRILWTFQAYQASPNDHMEQIVRGNGNIASLTLQRINLGAFYTRDAGASSCAWPCRDFNGPMWVTQEVRSSTGLGSEYRSTYRYAGAKSDQRGRGFLGFRQMVVRDDQTGVEQVTSYRQDYPFTGLVASREKKLVPVVGGAGTLLNRSTNSYSSTDLGGTRRYPFLTSSLEESFELNGQVLPSVTTSYQYDTYGNATQVSVSTGDGHSKVTSNTYQNDATNWLLGRLTRSEVTSTTPGQ